MKVIKRSGEEVEFDSSKILNAVLAVNNDVSGYDKVDEQMARAITENITLKCETFDRPINIEEIQDLVENELMLAGKHEASKQYIIYRFKRSQARQNKALTEKLMASNVQNQNANVDEASFGGRLGEAASFVTKQYALDHLMSKMAVRNHLNNEIYTHDLDSYALGSHNCLSIPFDKLLAEGFNTRHADVRPAGSVDTAFQLIAVIFQLQSLQQFGGVAATHLDWTMVPYVRLSFYKHYNDGLTFISHKDPLNLPKEVRKNTSMVDETVYSDQDAWVYADRMTERELSQAVEGFVHNMNTLQSRSGCQLPFTSINYGTCTLPEGRMVIKALIAGSIAGCGKFHKTSIFPCGIFQCMKGVNRKPGDPNYDMFRLALRSTAQRIYPNYANCEWSVDEAAFKQDRESKQKIIQALSDEDMQKLASRIVDDPLLGYKLDLTIRYDENDIRFLEVDMTRRRPFEVMSTMGCRTYNGFDINSIESYEKNVRAAIEGKSLYDDVESGVAKDGRGNICPVTIILPTLAMEAGSVDVFMELLDKKIGEAKDQLIERFNWICSQSPAAARFMYENGTMYGYKPEEGIRSALKHGTLAMGQLGLAECLQILIGVA